jgi:hypothetical protein
VCPIDLVASSARRPLVVHEPTNRRSVADQNARRCRRVAPGARTRPPSARARAGASGWGTPCSVVCAWRPARGRVLAAQRLDGSEDPGGGPRRWRRGKHRGTRSFGTLRASVARSRSREVRRTADLQELSAMARPGLEPGTPRFSAVVSSTTGRGHVPAAAPIRTEDHSARLALPAVRPARSANTTRARVTSVAGLSRCHRRGREPTAPRDARCSSGARVARAVVDTIASLAEAGVGPPRGARRERWSLHAPGGGATSRGCRPSAGASAGPREPGRLDERGQPATDPRPRKLLRLISRSWRGCRCRPARSGGRLRRRRDSGCGARRAGHTPRATGRRAGLDRCAEDANIARGLAGDDGARSGAQASAQSRLRRMQRTNSCTSSSPRQESAQPVQVAAQSTHSSMLRTSLSRSGPGRCGCALDHLLNRHFDPLLARAWPR